jgi:hypothetical protein
MMGNICCWKRRKNPLDTEFDARYGAHDITAPNKGGYASPTPQAGPTTEVVVEIGKVPPRRAIRESEKSPGADGKLPSPASTAMSSGASTSSQPSSPRHKPVNYKRVSVPVHQAYIAEGMPSKTSASAPGSPGQNPSNHSPPTGTFQSTSPGHPNYGLPANPRSGQAFRSASNSIKSTPQQSPTGASHHRTSPTPDQGDGTAIRHVISTQSRGPLAPPPLPQVAVPLIQPAPAKKWHIEPVSASEENKVEQWPGQM